MVLEEYVGSMNVGARGAPADERGRGGAIGEAEVRRSGLTWWAAAELQEPRVSRDSG